jgi:EmrB/QacA subfamily drug resistance transporter
MTWKPPCDEAAIRAAPCLEQADPRERRAVLVAAVLGSSLVFMDGTIVNVALPTFQRELGATIVEAQWVVEAYALFLSALLLAGGALGDRYGRRRLFALGAIVFSLASAACGLAPNLEILIAARALQGVGGALLTPGSLALISAAFSEQDRGRAIGTWSGASGIAAAIGPVAGGYLIDRVSWRLAFLINLPLAAVALYFLHHVTESRDESAGRTDWLGATLCTLGLAGVVFGLLESSRLGFGAPAVLAPLTGGVLLLAAFLFVERRRPAPMVPLVLFGSRPFSVANWLTLLLYAALGGTLFFLPFVLIELHGYSATGAGAALLPFVVIVFLLSRWAGALVDRYGSRGPLVAGPLLAALGFALLAYPAAHGSYFVTFFPAVCVLGLGMATTIAPLTTTVMNSAPARQAGVASGVNNAVSRTAGLLAVALFSLLLLHTFDASLTTSLDALPLPRPVRAAIDAERIRLAAIELPAGTPADLRPAVERAIEHAFQRGFRAIALLSAALAALGGASAALLFPRERQRRSSS